MTENHRYRVDGRNVCTFSSEQMLTGIERADVLYARFCKAAERHARETVTPYAAKLYEDDPDPKKRFRYTPTVCVCSVRITSASEELLCIEGEYRVGERSVSRFTHVWDRETGLILPPRRTTRAKGRKIRNFRGLFR